MKHFISSLSVLCANTPPYEGRISSRKILSLLLILFLSIGNVWGAEVESYSATFTSVTNHSYTQNKTFTLNGKSWTASVSQVASSVFYLGCNSNNASKGILANNSTFAEIVTALKSVDAKYSSTSDAHAYALLFDNAYDNVTKVNFAWSGGNNAFQVYLFGYTNSAWVLLGSTNYATSGTSTAGSVEWTGTAANYAKFAVVARPGATNSTASNKTLRAKSFKIYTDDTPVGATKYAVTIDPNIENGTVTASPTEATEGATVTLTATPDAGYKFGGWDVKDASSNAVTVTDNKFTMPASNVTVSASFVAKTQYTIKWNVAEGSVADTKVYEGEALGSLPTAQNCSAGKVFVGWTAAISVNPDGSGITYVKATDIPNGDKVYNAVYALEGAGETEETSIVNFTGGGKNDLGAIEGITSYGLGTDYAASNAPYQVKLDGDGDYIQFKNPSAYQITTIELVVKMLGGGNTSTLKIQTSNDGTTFTDLNSWSISGSQNDVKSTTITVNDTHNYLRFYFTKGSNVGLGKLVIKAMVSKTSYTNYSLDCGTNNTPFLTVTETAIDFGTVAQNETATETFTVTGGYLAEDVALTISGTNASFFSVSPATIAKADDVEGTETITYTPTETGDHTATLTIKTGDITKEIALSGKVLAPGKWVLVKDIATLSAGDEIIIASAASNYAIGGVATNNYKGAAITKVGETANADASVTVLTVEETGVAEAPFAFKTDGKYLYAAGSDKNYLRAQATNNENGQWAVTITEGVASIVAAKSSNRNVMQCNPNGGSPIFACYSSASYEALAIYRNSENVAKPVISGEVNFVGSTQVTITAKSGLAVYYTTDGSDPDNTSTQYTAPFTINATTTVKAIACDASSNASGVAEMTFTKHELVNVATAMALAKDEVAYFAEFEVVKVVTGKGNIYIKDASGHGLIYDNTLAGELKDGDRVQGFVGVSSPYNGLPEAKPVDGLTVADLTITSGVAAEPYDFTSTAIAATDINKYVVFNDVEIATAVSMSNSDKEFSLTINSSNVAFYNQFSIEKTLEAGKTYDIYGFVSIYNEKLQVYFYQALEEDEVVTKYTVTYNAGGATGEVPVDDNEYTKGAQVYLKSAAGLTKEGYDYKGWKVTDEGGNEIAVSSNKFNMPASNVTVTAQWEEIVVTPRQDFSAGYWVLVSSASELTAGDKIMITAAEEDLAMKSYESGNNCQEIAITKLGEGKFVKWISEVGVFELAANGSNYTIQDVNTKDYLYAAGSGNNNYLKAADEIPTTEEKAKYLWTISFTDGVPTVKATSENRNTLMYNTGSNLFACYASGQKDIALYKYVTSVETTKVSPSVEKGIFSVGNGEFVQFSTGNLQYEVGTNTWSFAANQYDYVGEDNINVGDPTFTGTIDMFGWSTNDADNNYGVNPNNVNELYDGTFQDWSALVDEADWYTLSADEWKYLLNKRTNASSLKQIAKVNNGEKDIVGIMLFPDAWTMPADVNVTATYDDYFKVNIYNYTLEQWEKLEAVGAVFLPAAGRRTGGWGNTTISPHMVGVVELDSDGHYKYYDNGNIYCYYWTSTINESTKDVSYLHNIQALVGDKYTIGTGAVWGEKGRYGQSVRLVKAIEPDYTRAVTPGNLGTICLPSNVPAGHAFGATFYTLAGKDANGRIAFNEVTTGELAAGVPYLFQAQSDVLYCFYGTTIVSDPINTGAMKGTFVDLELTELSNIYYFAKNALWSCVDLTKLSVPANCAYVDMGKVTDITEAASVGVRRITLGVNGAQVATSVDQVQGDEVPTKMIINGQLFILRGEKMYDAQGKLVK